ncbi:hypothetical protein ScPMuIL_015966 [Solemya velum]
MFIISRTRPWFGFSVIRILRQNTLSNVTLHKGAPSRGKCLFCNAPHRFGKYLSYSTQSDNLAQNKESKLKPRYLYVRTSQERWEELPDGLVFDVAYLDTHPGSQYDPNVPLIVALHDSPGSHEQFQPIFESLTKLGYRVIAPNFPGFGFTAGIAKSHDDTFLHSTDERAQLVSDFLSELGIKRVDILLGLRTGCYPSVRLVTGAPDVFRSLILLSPAGHKPYREIQPFELYITLSSLWDRPFFRPLLRVVLFFLKYRKPAFRKHTIGQIVPAIHTVANVGFEEFGGFLVTVDQLKVPCCMVYSDTDCRVESEVLEEFADLLGKRSSDFMQIDKSGHAEPSDDHYSGLPKGIHFQNDVEDPLTQQSGHIVKLIWDLMKFIRKS